MQHIAAVALGDFHTLVLLSGANVVLACGWNRWGQLGLGDTNDRHELTPVEALRDKGVTQVCVCVRVCVCGWVGGCVGG